MLLENLKIQAKKLALLLANSTMPEDIKEAWAVLIPEMTLEQIAKLLNILEAMYLDEQTKGIDEKYTRELAEAVKNLEKKRQSEKNKLLDQLKQLAQIYE